MNNSKKVTIQDVAKYAKVSTGTIDRVIHDRGNVSEVKRKAVEKAIEHLGFNPNFLASTLAFGKQFVICTLLPEATASEKYWSLPKKGVKTRADEYKDFGFVIDSYEYSLFDESSFVEHAQTILGKNPSGVILAPLFEKESNSFLDLLEEQNIPYVFIDADIPNREALSYIGPDLNSSGHVAGKLLSSILCSQDNILIVHMVKGIENSSHIGVMEKGFLDYFEIYGNSDKRKISSLTIQSTEKAEVLRELTKYYIKNPNIKGVFVTNSRGHLIADFHKVHDLNIQVIGFDIIEENIASMKNDGIMFLLSQSPVFQGKWAVQAFFDLFVYKREPEKIHHVPINIIIKENLDFYMNSHLLHNRVL